MIALGRFGRFTLSHHLSHIPKHLPWLCLFFVLAFGFGCVCCFVVHGCVFGYDVLQRHKHFVGIL